MEQVIGMKFKEKTVKLDGKDYVACEFTDCELMYAGGEVGLRGNSITRCRIFAAGAAARTVVFLRHFYHQGAQEAVEKLFDRIRKPLPEDQG